MVYMRYVVAQKNFKLKRENIYAARDLLLLNAFGFSNAENSIKTGIAGKPYIKNAEFDFSLSDTDNVAVVSACGDGVIIDDAVCIDIKAKKIGVDIESAQREISKKSILSIANKYFTEREIKYLKKNNQSIKQNFLDIWTKKESILKATGEGLKALKNADTFSPEYTIQTKHIFLNNKPYIVSFAVL